MQSTPSDPRGTSTPGGAPPPRRSAIGRFAPLAAFLLLGVVLAHGVLTPSDGSLPSPLIGRAAPALDMPLLDRGPAPGPDGLLAEGRLTNADLANGRVSVVNLWASWCAPCRIEHPQLMALAERNDIDVYGVAFQDEPVASRRFLQELGDPFTAVGVDPEGLGALRWGVEGVPETFVVDGGGVVVFKHTGEITAEELETLVIPAIDQAKRR